MKTSRPKNKILTLILMIAVLVLLFACQTSQEKRTRVLLIGLDGAGWNVINPLIAKGKLPNIKQLMDAGCYGVMQSSYPLRSASIWTGAATGKHADKHGITDNLMKDPNTKEKVPPSSNLRKVKAIWNILSENNRRVGIVNYLVTWPPEKVNGVVISQRRVDIKDITYLSKDLSYPRFTELCSEEEFESFKNLKEDLFSWMDTDKFPEYQPSFQKIDNFMANFAKHLLKKQSFDFFCLYLQGIDEVSHRFWKYLFPDGFDVSKENIERYQNVINNYYIWCDGIIGDILREAGKVDVVVIASDHGLQAEPKVIRIDYLLEICGLAHLKRSGRTIRLENEPKHTQYIKIIGQLSPDEFDTVREHAKQALKEIVVKETGDYFFGVLKDTQYGFWIKVSKSCRKLNPEHHVILKGKEYRITDLLSEIKDIRSGDHSTSAVIILSGNNIYRNKEIKSATTYDITPTILYYLGLPVAKDMEGKVLLEAIKKNYLKISPVQYIDTYETRDKKDGVEKPVRSYDEEKIKERMRSLGYIN